MYALTTGSFIDQLCAVDNLFIRQLANLATNEAKNLKLVSLVLKDKVSNRGEVAQKGVHPASKSVIDLTKLTPLTSHFQSKTLMEEIAQYRASTLNFPEHQASPTWWRDNAEILLIDYILSSALCYVEVFDNTARVEKFFATRNRRLAGLLAGLADNDTAKYVSYLQTYSVNYASRQLKILKLNVTKTGFSITQPRSFLDFNKSIKITPFFLMSAFVDGVSDILANNIIKFKYIKDNLTEREFISTLSPQILLTYYDSEFVQKMLSTVGVQLNRGYVRLPELGISKYDQSGVRALNVSRVTELEIVTSFETRYIDVDFDTIVPAFRETILNLRDLNLLSAIHVDLLGQPATVANLPIIQGDIINHVEGQVAIGSTMALRYLHDYMIQRQKFFPMYNGGRPVQYGAITNDFNLGLSDQ